MRPAAGRAAEQVVAIDLGGTKIAAAAVDRQGACGPVITRPTPAREGPDQVLAAVAEAVREVSDTTPRIIGAGVGAAGVIDAASGTVLSATDAITDWSGTRIADALGQALNLPVAVDNDVNAHAAGEAWLGAGQGCRSVLMTTIGTGVGGAVILDGQPVHGAHHVGGEIGHAPARGAEHLPCGCGRRGHLEAIASGPGLLRHYHSIGGDRAVADTREVFERARVADTVALRAVREAASALGTCLAGLIMLMDPDVVVVGGGLAEAGQLWWRPMESALRCELIDIVAGVPVKPAELGGKAALVGAAHRAWQQLGTETPKAAPVTSVVESLRGGLVVSCQAYPGEPMRHPQTIAQLAQAACSGGAAGIRTEGPDCVATVQERVPVPVIGLWKEGPADGVFITPTLAHALTVVRAGADVVAVDGTRRPRPDGLTLAQVVDGVHSQTDALVMADCGSLDDALAASDAGVDLIGTTLAGYTGERPRTNGPDLELVSAIAERLPQVPLLAEGRVHVPAQGRQALDAGAFAVVVGTAITHPATITGWFVEALGD